MKNLIFILFTFTIFTSCEEPRIEYKGLIKSSIIHLKYLDKPDNIVILYNYSSIKEDGTTVEVLPNKFCENSIRQCNGLIFYNVKEYFITNEIIEGVNKTNCHE